MLDTLLSDHPDPEATKRKATTSLANYDLNFLKVWYNALVDLNGKSILCR